jgi:hypothetical protein
LAPGSAVFALIKTVAIDRRGVGRNGETIALGEAVQVFDG